MISKVHALQMFIGLAVQLTIRLQVSFIAAQSTSVVVVIYDDDELLREAEPRSILVDVIIQLFEVIGVEV